MIYKMIELLECNHPDTGELVIEEFRIVEGFEQKYEVSSFGRVLSLKSGVPKLMKICLNKRGYPHIVLSHNGMSITQRVHKLVAKLFLGHTPQGMVTVIHHKDSNKTNNKIFNLEITTQRTNLHQKVRTKTSQYVGVCWDKKNSIWKARIFFDNRDTNLGHFKTEIEAHHAYQNKLTELNRPQNQI